MDPDPNPGGPKPCGSGSGFIPHGSVCLFGSAGEISFENFLDLKPSLTGFRKLKDYRMLVQKHGKSLAVLVLDTDSAFSFSLN
jgi:hypothetical protein